MGFKEGHGVLRGEAGEGGIQEAGIPGHVLQNLLPGAGVGQVAASLSRNIQFLAQALVGLQQQDPGPGVARLHGGKRPGGAAADYDYVVLIHKAFPLN